MKNYSDNDFRLAFQQGFKFDIWQDWLANLFGASLIHQKPVPVKLPPSEKDGGIQGFLLGELTTSDGVRMGLFRYTVPAAQIERRRVGLNRLVEPWVRYDFDAALVVFDAKDTKKWRFSLVADMRGDKTSPKRYTYVFGDSTSQYRTAVGRFMKVRDSRARSDDKPVSFAVLKEAFAVESLTKEFYGELFNWYLWALSPEAAVTFPNDISTDSDDRIGLEERLIRLITRLMFVWFILQKKLVPDELFNENSLTAWLKDFDPHSMTSGNYYNAILQNLFFATLNNEIANRAFATDARGFRGRAEDYGIKTLFRNPKGDTWFKRPDEEVLDLFKEVPFLNGGLFECLDKAAADDSKGRVIYNDGFSREKGRQRRAFIPNELFFGDESPRTFTVSGAQTTRTVSGLLKVLGRYNFTIEENTPDDMDVALDPELLGKVFENLLGSFNPETRETARKASGSFYTPREIVGYMVESALDAYMKPVADKPEQEQLAHLMKIRVLDPACGSGAFPMGMLNAIVARAQKLGATDDLHALKLHVIENCIFGVDIQTIAVQIAKLRFFISLVCEEQPNLTDAENNYGISPLPNLETKFVAANSLIEKKKPQLQGELFQEVQIEDLKQKLNDIRHRHFKAKTRKDKLALRKEDEKTREELVAQLADGDIVAAAAARQLVEWNPYEQNESADFFDPEWMFGVEGGFDVVIGNPPYKQIPKGMYSALQFPYAEGKDKGKQNLYKVFVEHGYNIAKADSGIVSLIVQSSLMGDMTAKFTRDLLLSKSTIQHVIEFPKNAPTPAGKVFKSVLQGTCIVQFTTCMPEEEHQFYISIRNDISTVDNFLFERMQQKEIKAFYPDYFEIPLVMPGEGSAVAKVKGGKLRVKDFVVDAAQGNINTIHLNRIKSNRETGAYIAKGAHIHRWIIDDDLLDCSVTEDTKAIFARNCGQSMILSQNISGTTDKRRINAAPLVCRNTKIVFLDTANILYLRCPEEMKFICAILNCKLTDWIFRMTSTNNHLNMYELEVLPVPDASLTQQSEIVTLVDKILAAKNANPAADTSAIEREIDELVFDLYGLTPQERETVQGDEQ